MCRKAKQKKGFTLIEVMISLTIFVVGIVLLFPFFSGGVRMLGDIDAQTTIANLARSKMTEIETQGFRVVPTNVSRVSFPDPYGDFDYEVQWQPISTDVAAATNTILFQVDLTIYWQSGSGEKSEHFKTFISRLRPY